MTLQRRIVIGLCVALLAGCASTPKVGVDHSPTYPFAGKARFAVLRPEVAVTALASREGPVMNDLLAERLTVAIERNLRERGFDIVAPEQADMYVTFFVTSEDRTAVHTYNTGFGYGACWDPWRCAAWATPEVSVQQYQVGTLYIDFIDPASTTLQWRGTTSQRLPSNPSQAKRDALAEKVVHAIIDQFPPGRNPG